VVHITSGVSALVFALYLGKRKDYPDAAMRPHSLTLSVVGACMLWVGWFGFNAGSAVAASPLATTAFVATHFAAASAALSWSIAEWVHVGKPSMLGAISGCVAGLVAITPASGFVTPMASFAIGLAAGVVCFLMVTTVKKAFGYDDSLDAFGVHGAGGTLGAILTGVFATNAINDTQINGKVQALGLVDGHGMQIGNQLVGVLVAVALAALGTLIILKITESITGLRVKPDEEEQGLDLSQHGEEGYFLDA
jgi:Amt family ammonium transporter